MYYKIIQPRALFLSKVGSTEKDPGVSRWNLLSYLSLGFDNIYRINLCILNFDGGEISAKSTPKKISDRNPVFRLCCCCCFFSPALSTFEGKSALRRVRSVLFPKGKLPAHNRHLNVLIFISLLFSYCSLKHAAN